MNDYISKPIDPDALFATVGRWLGRPVQKLASASSTMQIEGVDTRGGLSRVAGNEQLYFSLLQDLAKQRHSLIEALEIALLRKDAVMLEHLAHTLKGLAGNLGLGSVERYASDLESIARGSRVPATAEGEVDGLALARSCLAPLHNALNETCEHIMAVISIQQASPFVPQTDSIIGERERLINARAAVNRMAAVLEMHDGSAIDQLQELIRNLGPLIGSGRLDSLREKVSRFDFENARRELLELSRECLAPLEAESLGSS
jgi:two-component system sensor histidine kinase/response regulator